MPISSTYIFLIFLLISSCYLGFYLEWEAIRSFQKVIDDLYTLTTVLWTIREDITDLSGILEVLISYYKLHWNTIVGSSILISVLILVDRIPSSWKQLTLGNRVVTSRYNNKMSLIFNETLAYLLSIPNLITLTIGILQASSTLELVKTEYPVYLNLLGLIVFATNSSRFSLNLKPVIVSTYFLLLLGLCLLGIILNILETPIYLIRGNFVNIGVSILCWLFAVYQELVVFSLSSKLDEIRNGTRIRVINSGVGVPLIYRRAEMLKLGDTIMLREGEITPAFIQVERLRYICDGVLDDYNIGTYYDKESTGEDVSRKFIKGDILPSGRRLTRPDIEITGVVTGYVKYDNDTSLVGSETVPHFLDRVRIIADLIGFLLLLIIATSISASALSRKDGILESINSGEIVAHILAATISANVLIPSMRMTLLYNVYNLVLSKLYGAIKINRYSGITKLDKIDRIIFDKTGTLTEECLEVGNCHLYPENKLEGLSEKTGWSNLELQFALAMANNESNINPKTNEVWGISPEECEILKYWISLDNDNDNDKDKDKDKDKEALINPLNDTGTLSFSLDGKQYRTIKIIKRYPYEFGKGKLAEIQLLINNDNNKSLTIYVRQDGTSHISSTLSDSVRKWCENCEKTDPRRSISIAYSLQDNQDNQANQANPDCEETSKSVTSLINLLEWDLLAIYSFSNPLRAGVSDLIRFVTTRSLIPYILTGDGSEAAEEVSRRAGFPPNIVRFESLLDSSSNLDLSSLKNQEISCNTTLMISGSQLEHWISTDSESAGIFLDKDRHHKVIYRASSQHKEIVAKLIDGGLYVGDAANDAAAIQHSSVGIALAHGADICRLKADLVLNSPSNLVDLLVENGYRDMLLAGGERLLEDVCWMGGLTAGCLVIGLHRHGFQFLANSPLYIETWKPLPMLVVSSFQYTISVLAYASADCESPSHCWRCLILASTRWHIFGLICGGLLAWSIKHLCPEANFSYLVLHALDITVLFKHSWHCWHQTRPRLARRRSGGLFGNQYFASKGLSQRIGFCLCILDSIPARCLLYGIFTLLGEGYF